MSSTNTITSGPLAGLAWWAPGMRNSDGEVCITAEAGGPAEFVAVGRRLDWRDAEEWDEPDLSDAATRGVLLEQLREVLDALGVWLEPVVSTESGEPEVVGWMVIYRTAGGYIECAGDGDTEAEAIIAALKAAGGRG